MTSSFTDLSKRRHKNAQRFHGAFRRSTRLTSHFGLMYHPCGAADPIDDVHDQGRDWKGRMSDEFGSVLRRWRIQRGLTQRQIAEAIGVTPSYVNLLERGRTRAPTIQRCRQLAGLLQLDEQVVITAALQERAPAIQELLDAATSNGQSIPIFEFGSGSMTDFNEQGVPIGKPVGRMFTDDLGDPNVFGCRLRSDSFVVGYDEFQEGDVLVFSPGALIRDDDYVLTIAGSQLSFGRVSHLEDGRVRCVKMGSQSEGIVCENSHVGVQIRLVRRIQSF